MVAEIIIKTKIFLMEHATHYLEQYEKNKADKSNQTDALYFVNMLKASDAKTGLLKRIQ